MFFLLFDLGDCWRGRRRRGESRHSLPQGLLPFDFRFVVFVVVDDVCFLIVCSLFFAACQANGERVFMHPVSNRHRTVLSESYA